VVVLFYDGIIIESSLAENRRQAIDTLCGRLYSDGRLSNLKAFRDAVYKRESEMSTELAPSVFVPHAKSEAVLKPSVAMMKTKDGESVFLIASNSDEGHIKALADLASALGGDATELIF